MQTGHHRPIRSFVLRQGRLTSAQEHALTHYWENYGIDLPEHALNGAELFGNTAPVTLEIGFGNGESLLQMARNQPEHNFIGIEVHAPGVGHLLSRIHELQLANLKVMHTDAVEVLKKHLAPASLQRILIYFPDPWHKKRHNKRRLIQPELVSLLGNLLEPGGLLHLATDWEDYALHMAGVMQASPLFRSLAPDGTAFSPRPDFRPLTKFEQRGLRLGHGVRDLLYQRL
ncbi:MAG: tRNA (guanosine(46)-N7)-methyltransferase TrmB [Thiothrix sp.]|nr:tRNA (guanosine(46)-N7)-methyltransferase TrmB [Thiothrix sp.]